METHSDISVDVLVRNLLALHPLLSKSFKEIRTQTNLNPGSLYVLALIEKHQSLTMTEIGCKLGMPKPHVTMQVDKLISDELVKRNYSENDRRVIKITLTQQGLDTIHTIISSISNELRSRIETLEQEKLKAFFYAALEVRNTLSDIMDDNSKNK